MEYYNIKITLKADTFFIHSSKIRVRSNKARKKRLLKFLKIGTTVYQFWVKRFKNKQLIKFFTISLKDIEKVLKVRKKTDSKQYFNKFYQDRKYLDIFTKAKNKNLPPFQRPEINHGIDLEKIDKKDVEVLWGLLYNISQKKLLILRKELIRFLDKGFI